MKMQKWFENWDMKGLKLNLGFLQTDWEPQVKESDAAWELYVELLTRTATQPLPDDAGVEAAALASVHSLFEITRGILRHYGRETVGFAKVAVIVLNQVIRPFTSRWHRLSDHGAFENGEQCAVFREELGSLQETLRNYMGMLAGIAGVEDISPVAAPLPGRSED